MSCHLKIFHITTFGINNQDYQIMIKTVTNGIVKASKKIILRNCNYFYEHDKIARQKYN